MNRCSTHALSTRARLHVKHAEMWIVTLLVIPLSATSELECRTGGDAGSASRRRLVLS